MKEFIKENLITKRGHVNPHICKRYKEWFKENNINYELNKIIEITKFLSEDAPLKERIYCILHNITQRRECIDKDCSNPVNFHNSKYQNFCSYKCRSNNKNVREATSKTCLKKYGVINASQSSIAIKKIKEANIRNKEILSKKSTRHWFFYYQEHNEKKYKEANLKPLFSTPTKTNDKMFKCLICDTNFKYGDYSSFLGNGLRCPFCNPKRESKLELLLCKWLDEIGINYIRNDRKMFGVEIDILIPDFRLGIEVDGVLWHSFGKSKYHYLNNFNSEDKNIHLRKTEILNKQNFNLLRFTDIELNDPIKLNIIKSMLRIKFGLGKRVFARKCVAHEISTATLKHFLEENHLIGKVSSSKKFGLFFEGELIQVISFGKPRFNKTHNWELYRLCTKQNFIVVGGFSKLLKYSFHNGVNGSVQSFVDRRFSDGNGYKAIGFEFKRYTPPNYFYLNSKSGKVVKRYSAQKKKLPALLKTNFDINLTETENMYNSDFRKMYDCGNLVFEINLDPNKYI